jgi:hypothetical protein
MLFPLVLSVILAIPTGTIEGSIAPPERVKITKPVQVVVFSGEYVNLYLAEVQKRLDNYWENYKAAFIQDKEAFLLFRERAQHQAMDFALNRMRMDDPGNAANFVHTATNNSFNFRNVPQGECKIVAVVTVGSQEFIWSQSVILTEGVPGFVTLKPTTP